MIGEMYHYFVEFGFDGRFEACTPINNEIRHNQIKEYLDNTSRQIESFVIIDDDPKAGIGFDNNFVHINHGQGLDKEYAEQAISILNA